MIITKGLAPCEFRLASGTRDTPSNLITGVLILNPPLKGSMPTGANLKSSSDFDITNFAIFINQTTQN